MSILGLIAAEQAKDKVKKGYTPLPEDANWFETLNTSLSNAPNVADDAVKGVMELLTNPEARKQLHKSLSDFTLGAAEKINEGPLFDTELGKKEAPNRIETVDQAINSVKEIFTDERKAKEFISQNPDVLAGGVWGASKVGKFVEPKAKQIAEEFIENQGLVNYIVPPSKTFGKDDAYTSTEYLDLGKDVGDSLSRAAHKFRGQEGYMAVPGYGKGISEENFIKLMNNDQATFKKFGAKDSYDAVDLLQERVGLDRLEEMLAGSAVVLEKPLYIERAEGFSGKGKKAPVDVKDKSLYSATVIDPKNAELMRMKSPYGENPYIIKLEPGTKIYHPGRNADLNEVVVIGKDIDKSQGMKKSDYEVTTPRRKYGDTLFDWDQIEKDTKKLKQGTLDFD